MNQQIINFGGDQSKASIIKVAQAVISDRETVLANIRAVHTDNSARSQCTRILAALQRLGSVTTIECTRFLDVVHPPRRVMELRDRGHDIETTWVHHPTECGRMHRVGLYVLNGSGV